VFADQPRFECPFAIARHLNPKRAVIGQDSLAARPIAMIRAVGRLVATRRVAEVMRQLAPQGALDDRLLKPANRRVEFLWGDRTRRTN
jgi:hypothetical protein